MGNTVSTSNIPIRVINYESFKKLSSFPRYPENQDLCIDIATLDRKDKLLVFISHCWLRGYDKAPGYDGRPHPDNATHDKFKLCVEGIEKTLKIFAPGAKECYIWLDFGCMDQDGNPAGELKQLDEIMRNCDCIFTPIFGENRNTATTIANYYDDYHAAAWNEGEFSYTQRGWCRVEMLYAANIPVIEDKRRAEHCFQVGFRFHVLNGVRPHLLYGTSESKKSAPIILPPLQNSYYEKLDPKKGNVTVKDDRAKIDKLYNDLKPHFKVIKDGYEGDYLDGKRSGKGVYRYADGAVYEGDWLDGKMSGKGVYRYADGDVYEGDWLDGKRSGKGVFRYANGDVYEGDFLDGKMSSGQLFIADVHMKFSAAFSGGDDIVDGFRLYHAVLRNDDSSIFREGKFSNGKFI